MKLFGRVWIFSIFILSPCTSGRVDDPVLDMDFFRPFPGNNKDRDEINPSTAYNGPLIWDYTYENALKLSNGDPLENQLWFLLAKNSGDYEKFKPIAEEIAKDYYGKIIFVTVDVDDESNLAPLNSIQARAREAPTMRLLRIYGSSMDIYKPDNPKLTKKDNIRKFVQDFFDGNLLAEPMSEVLPDDWNAKPVKILTRENFDQVVNDREKEVVVFFFAPWCHACQEFHPFYDHLADALRDREALVLAKIDTTKNDIDTPISYLPTIKLFRREDNKVIMFEGRQNRSYKRLMAFIKSHGEFESVDYGQRKDAIDDIPVPPPEPVEKDL